MLFAVATMQLQKVGDIFVCFFVCLCCVHYVENIRLLLCATRTVSGRGGRTATQKVGGGTSSEEGRTARKQKQHQLGFYQDLDVHLPSVSDYQGHQME